MRISDFWDQRGIVLCFILLSGGTWTTANAAFGPGQPVITSPSPDAVVSNLTVRWKAIRGARSYEVCIGTPGCTFSQRTRGSSVRYSFNQSPLNTMKGKRVRVYVKACSQPTGGTCNARASSVAVYVMGPPVRLSNPADGTNYNLVDRRPTFLWQPYNGIAGNGNVTYTLSIWGSGAPKQVFSGITGTSYRPSTAINRAFRNPVRWSVTAHKGRNRSVSATRKLTLAGAPPREVYGPNLQSPNNGATVDTGSQLRWAPVTGAGSYKVCLGLSSNGCNITRRVNASNTGYTLTANDLRMFRNKTMYWAVQAIASGGTSVANSARRSVQVSAGASASTVSFAALAPTYRHPRCVNCHNFMRSGGSANSGTLGRHWGENRFAPSVDPTRPNNACNGCHQNQSGGEWMAPIAAHSFTGKSEAALCALTKALGSAAAVSNHLKHDERILWAISPASGLVASPPGKAPPGNIAQWNTLVDRWISGGMRCQ